MIKNPQNSKSQDFIAGNSNASDMMDRMRIKEQARVLYMQAPVSNIVLLFITALFTTILQSRLQSSLIVIWFWALCFTSSIRLSLWYFRKTRPDYFSPRIWLKYYFLTSTLVGLSWSLIYPLLYLSNDIVVIISLSMLAFGIAGASVIALSIYLPSFMLYTYPQLISVIVTLLMFDDRIYYQLAFAVFTYLIMITLFAFNLNRNWLRAIDLQAQNSSLIEELSEEVSQRETLIIKRTQEVSEKNENLTREITERKKIENKLVKSERHLSSIISSSPAGMALFDTDFRYLLINETLARINGLNIEDHIGKTIYEVLPDSQHLVGSLFQQVLDTKQPLYNQEITGEVGIRPGVLSHFLLSYFPILDAFETAVGIGAVVIDITDHKKAEQALKESEERFVLAMQGANDGLFDWDLVNNSIYYSPRWKSMLGFEDNELPNDFSVWEDKIDSADRERSWDMLSDYIKGNRDNFKLEFKMRHKDGHWIDILSRAFLVRDEKGNAIRTVGTHVDISELKNKDEKIKVLSQALEQSPVLVVITDPDANIEYVNKTFERITGYSADEVIGKNPSIFKSGLTPLKRYKEIWRTLTAQKTWSGEIQNRKKNGEIYWELAHIAPVINNSGHVTHYVAVKEDITEKKSQEEKILHQAHYDSLTKLPNRFLALDRLAQSLTKASRDKTLVAVLFLDLDGFKRINDSLGHEVGDRLLIQAAERLSASIRAEDTLCRLGGDEFITIIQSLNHASEAQLVAESHLACFRDAFILDDRELIVTASIGIAVYPQDGVTSAELLRNADTAMYYSKDLGRNNYHYFLNSMNKDISRDLAIEEQLHGALARDELYVLYQPLVDLRTKTIIGVEALLRWNSAVLGEISPEDFIPIAEQTGSIDEIGIYVLSQAMGWSTRWREMHSSEFTIAVNLSPAQFRDPELASTILQLLKEHNLPANILELEITEGVLLSGYPYIDNTINTFKQLGIGISMDDFGTGYSSLSYLRSYPFNTLKIDRSFVNDISIDEADRELINAAISMGHGLGLKVIAEGVETEDQLSQLIRLDCDIAQGYLFSKPVSADTISDLLKARNIAFNIGRG